MEANSEEAPLLATLYNSLANAYQQRNSSHQDRELAIQAYEKAISLQKKFNFRSDLAETLLKQGNLYLELNNFKQADNNFQQANKIFRSIKDKQGEADALKAIGDTLQFVKQHEEALNSYETALSLYREIGDKLGEANVLQELAKLAQTAQALEYLQQAQLLYIECGDIYNQSRNLLFIAEVLLDMGNKQGAEAALTNARNLATSINNTALQEYAQQQIRFLQDEDCDI